MSYASGHVPHRPPFFSVVIPTFNRADLLERTLNSVLRQRFTEYETIVVDDGSAENIAAVVSRVAPSARFYRQQNKGPGAARNLGATHALGRYIAFLDSDDLWFPWTLSNYHRAAQQFPDPACVIGAAFHFYEDDELDKVEDREPTFVHYSDYLASSVQQFVRGTGVGIFRTDLFRSLGGLFNHWFYCEDMDLLLRMGDAKNFVFVQAPPLMGYRQHVLSSSGDAGRTYAGTQYLIDQERAGRYPGGPRRRREREELLASHARNVSHICLQRHQPRLGVTLYLRTVMMNARLRQWKYLLEYPLRVVINPLRFRGHTIGPQRKALVTPSAAVTECDVAILIPSFRRPEMTRRALLSALATGAGEIIVSDDASHDGTVEALQSASADPRLKIVVQPNNLGLWPNHLALLRLATKPWIKFLQNDDWLEAGGLARMVAVIRPQTTLVAALSCYQSAQTGLWRTPRVLSQPRRFTSDQYVARMAVTGNEPGTPSDVLWRADALDASDAAWQNELSVDLLCNVLAASRGEVVLLPPGPVITLDHPGRDTHMQGFSLHVKRVLNTVRYLLNVGDGRVRRTSKILACREGLAAVRMAGGQLRAGAWLYDGFFKDLFRIFVAGMDLKFLKNLPTIYRSIRWKYFADDRGADAADMAGVCLDTDQPSTGVLSFKPPARGDAAKASPCPADVAEPARV